MSRATVQQTSCRHSLEGFHIRLERIRTRLREIFITGIRHLLSYLETRVGKSMHKSTDLETYRRSVECEMMREKAENPPARLSFPENALSMTTGGIYVFLVPPIRSWQASYFVLPNLYVEPLPSPNTREYWTACEHLVRQNWLLFSAFFLYARKTPATFWTSKTSVEWILGVDLHRLPLRRTPKMLPRRAASSDVLWTVLFSILVIHFYMSHYLADLGCQGSLYCWLFGLRR